MNQTQSNLLIEAVKERHRELGREIERASKMSTIKTKQRKRKKYRDIAVGELDMNRSEVNNWD